MTLTVRNTAVLSLLAFKIAGAADTSSPNKAIAKPGCDSSKTVSIRFSSTSERLYLESADSSSRGGCVTLKQIWEQREGKPPLYAVDSDSGEVSDTATGTWLLTMSLYVEDGITLQVGERTRITYHIRSIIARSHVFPTKLLLELLLLCICEYNNIRMDHVYMYGGSSTPHSNSCAMMRSVHRSKYTHPPTQL